MPRRAPDGDSTATVGQQRHSTLAGVSQKWHIRTTSTRIRRMNRLAPEYCRPGNRLATSPFHVDSVNTTESVTMATLEFNARRLLLAGGFAVAIAAAPAVAAFTVPTHAAPAVASCPNGESEDTFTGECTPELVPNSPEFQSSPGGLPSVDGIPCSGGNSGQCIGLSEDEQAAGPIAVPHSSVSSSP
jgi:hypothetical protein